jgi:hypothetical protein
MLEKCANPLCHAPFRRLGRGKLFAFDARTIAGSSRSLCAAGSPSAGGSSLFFWLCESCSLTLKLGVDAAGCLVMQSLPESGEGAGVDSGTLNHTRQLRSPAALHFRR